MTTVLEFIPAFLFPTLLPVSPSDGIARASTARRERRGRSLAVRRILRIRVPRSRCGRYLNKAHVRERILVNDSAYASPASLFLVVHARFPCRRRSHTPHAARHDLNRVLPPTRAHVGSHHPEDAPRAISFIAPNEIRARY